MKNIFYAVSMGPAGADYLTLKAIKTLKECNTIFYPITGTDSHVAFDCVCEAVDVSQKKCIGVHFSMSLDKAKTQSEYDNFVLQVESELKNGSVAFVAIGDVSIYSTSARLAKMIEKNGYEIKFIAGVTSFCASACECTLDIANRDTEIRIIPGDAYFKTGKLDNILRDSSAKIFMKSPKHLKDIIQKIIDFNLCEKAHLVQGVGYETQKIFSGENLKTLSNDIFEKAYMSVVIVEA